MIPDNAVGNEWSSAGTCSHGVSLAVHCDLCQRTIHLSSLDDLPLIPPWNRVRFRKALRKLLGLVAVLSVVGCAVPQMPSQAYSPNSKCDIAGMPHRHDGTGTHPYYLEGGFGLGGEDPVFLLCW